MSVLISAVVPCLAPPCPRAGDKACRVWSTSTGDCMADIAWDCGPVNFCSFVQYNDGGTSRALLLTCHVDQQRQEGRVMMWDVLEVMQHDSACWHFCCVPALASSGLSTV